MRAFILGNSGELLDHDLTLLKGETVFGCNALALRIPEIITHYVCVDILMAFVPEVRSLISKSAKKYYSRLLWNTIYQEDNVNVFDTHPDHLFGFSFSETNVYSGMTAAYVSLQIAAHQGFDEIYLLGIDLGLPKNSIMHIPEQEKLLGIVRAKNLANPTIDKRVAPITHETHTKKIQKHFIYAKAVLEERGINVVNLSKGGNLNCFKRENYEEILSDQGIRLVGAQQTEEAYKGISKSHARPSLVA